MGLARQITPQNRSVGRSLCATDKDSEAIIQGARIACRMRTWNCSSAPCWRRSPGRERTTIRWLLSAADFNMPFRAPNINPAGSHPDSAELIPAPTPTRIHMEQDYSYGQITR
jgi:hypothetical protein